MSTTTAEAETPVAEPAKPGKDITLRKAHETLARPPVIDLMNQQKLMLVKAIAAKGVSDAGVGFFLELCAHYDLAWEAKEAWCIPSGDRLLVMVGRDGLRKIATRNGIGVRGDVVREKDVYRAVHDDSRTVKITHEITGGIEVRGKIIGAWAEAWDEASGVQRGYFYAPDSEYRPTNKAKLEKSPWGSQESVMILAAAERQAIRQATPLGGLLHEGEMALNDERSEQRMLSGAGQAPDSAIPEGELGARLQALIERANELEPGAFPPARVGMETQGKDEAGLLAFADTLTEFIGERAPDDPLAIKDAEVVVNVPAEDVQEPEASEDKPEWTAEQESTYQQQRSALADLEAHLEESDLDEKDKTDSEHNAAQLRQSLEQLERLRPSDA